MRIIYYFITLVMAECIPTDDIQQKFSTSIIRLPERQKPKTDAWRVKRSVVEYYASHPLSLRKLGGTWTHRIDGKKVGFRVRPSYCGILFGAGFKTNDVITSVNGIKVATLLDAVAAYFKLKEHTSFTVNMLRSGKQVTQIYNMD